MSYFVWPTVQNIQFTERLQTRAYDGEQGFNLWALVSQAL